MVMMVMMVIMVIMVIVVIIVKRQVRGEIMVMMRRTSRRMLNAFIELYPTSSIRCDQLYIAKQVSSLLL